MIRFENQTERGLYDFMMTGGYKDSTARDYIHRLRKIKPVDTLAGENLANHIDDYTKGAFENMNKRAHNAYSSALKCLKKYVDQL